MQGQQKRVGRSESCDAPNPAHRPAISRDVFAWCVGLLCLLVSALFPSATAKANEAEAASTRYSIAVFASPPADSCFISGAIRAIAPFVKRRIAEMNSLPEFKDRKFKVDIYDDQGNEDQTIASVKKALDDPTTIAMIGLSGSNRAKKVFDALGKEIGDKGIPFISDLSVTSIFEQYSNVFTMRPSQENERLPLITKFLQDGKYQRPAYVGIANNVASAELLSGLSNRSDMALLSVVNELAVTDGKLESAETASVIQDLKTSDADLIMVMLGSEPLAQFMKEAAAAGLRAPMLILTEGEKAMTSEAATLYGANLYQLAWQTLPNIYNSRLRDLMLADPNAQWVFEDLKNPSATGWSNGKCKQREDARPLTALDAANRRAIGRGTRYADMTGIVGEIVKMSAADTSLPTLRAQIVKALKSDYASGRGTYRGAFDNWSFHPLSRTASQTPAILMRPRNQSLVRLAPKQYLRLRSDALRPIHTLYMDVDLIRIFRIDDNEKSFFAEFILNVTSAEKFDIADIEFSNAFLDAANGGERNITVTQMNGGATDGLYPEGIDVYKVTGKFMTRPDFSRYPFDTQLFTIQMKPKSGSSAFIIQPPAESLRDRSAETDGWQILDQYVGYDEDYIPITDARSEAKSIVPFYQVGFSWIMTREATDYFLRVVVPLAFILIVAYLSIFIPREHFEAVVTIQVTALLSAVALYLSIPKVGSDDATISDRIFLFDYMAVSLMIAVSVARVNPVMRRFPRIESILKFVHVFGVPLLVLGMAYYVLEGAAEQKTGVAVENGTTAVSAIPVKSNFDIAR